jgi:hypothetical protein
VRERLRKKKKKKKKKKEGSAPINWANIDANIPTVSYRKDAQKKKAAKIIV